MILTRVLSGLIGLGLLVGLAGGQQPDPKPKPAEKKKEAKPAADTLENAIATALKNNPDVRVAEAEAQLAQAKLAQTRLVVAQKVAAARAGLEAARQGADAIAQQLAILQQRVKGGAVSEAELLNLRATFARHQSEVARLEAEYNAARGVMPGKDAVAAAVTPARSVVWRREDLQGHTNYLVADNGQFVRLWTIESAGPAAAKPVAGSVADKLRAALDRPVKLDDQKNVDLGTLLGNLVKAAGLNVRVRVPPALDPAFVRDVVRLTVPGGEFPLGTWLQLAADEYAQAATVNRTEPGRAFERPARYELYVREYGLLMADPKMAPPGALTVQEFWDQVRAERAKATDAPAKE